MVDDPLLALRRVGFLVETLTAFAIAIASGLPNPIVADGARGGDVGAWYGPHGRSGRGASK